LIAYFLLGFLLVFVIHTAITMKRPKPDPFNDDDWVDADEY